MRIAQLANFSTPTSGGLRVVLDRFARAYVAAGHEVHRIIPGDDDEQEIRDGVVEHRVRAPMLPGMGGYRMILRTRRVDDLLELVDPDVVELSDKLSLVGPARRRAARGAGVVLISHERLDLVARTAVPGRMPTEAAVRSVNRRSAAVADVVVAASRFAAAEFAALGHRCIEHVPLGVDLTVFHPQQARPAALGTAPRAGLEMVSVGRLSPEKRPQTVIDMLAELVRQGVDARLHMIGDGPSRARLEARAVGLPVVFHGHVGSPAEVAGMMAAADLGVAPGPVETFGLAALEILACGTPVVVPASGGLPELLGESGPAGRVAEPAIGSSEGAALARAALHVVAIDQAARRRAARQRAEEFPWENAGEQMLAVAARVGRAHRTLSRVGS